MLLVGASGNDEELPGIPKGNHPFKASNDPFEKGKIHSTAPQNPFESSLIQVAISSTR